MPLPNNHAILVSYDIRVKMADCLCKKLRQQLLNFSASIGIRKPPKRAASQVASLLFRQSINLLPLVVSAFRMLCLVEAHDLVLFFHSQPHGLLQQEGKDNGADEGVCTGCGDSN